MWKIIALKMKSKRAAGLSIEFMVIATLLLGFLGFSVCSLSTGFAKVTSTTESMATGQLLDTCLDLENEYVTGRDEKICYNCDYDKDGLKDFCDNCPLRHNYINLDLDKDLFVQHCCGNDGNLKWIDDDPKSGFGKGGKVLNPKSLPCPHPFPQQLKQAVGGKRTASMTETTVTDDPKETKSAANKHPVYNVGTLLGQVTTYDISD